MKRFIFAVVMMVCATAFAANPAFSDFTLTQFGTNGNKIVVKSGASLTNLSEVGQLGVNNSVNGAATPAMILRNLDPTAVTLHATGEFIQMADTGSNVRNAAYFKVQKEQEWTTTASTRDAKYVLGLALDGNLVDQISISSAGNLALLQSGAGIVFSDATVQTTAATGGGETNWTRFPEFLAPTAFSNYFRLMTNGSIALLDAVNYWGNPNAGQIIVWSDIDSGHSGGWELFMGGGATSGSTNFTADLFGDDASANLVLHSDLSGRGELHLQASADESRIDLIKSGTTRVIINPTAADGSPIASFDSSVLHTTGPQFSLSNSNAPIFTVDFSGAITLAGTTNQITFGGTNTPPVSAVAPTKWISVKVAGEGAVYRVPLYE